MPNNKPDYWDEPMRQIAETHRMVSDIGRYAPHLSKLDALEDIKDRLLDSATGKDHLDKTVAILLFKILGIVIIGLLFCLVFLLTGESFGIIGALNR